MSRYIRTKNGEVFDTEVNGAWETTDGTIGIPTIWGIVVTPKAFIVKQADTIPELCDAFVAVTKDGQKHTYYSYERYVLAMMKCEEDGIETESYGAIWTTGKIGEPILRSVAKRKTTEGKEDLELLW